MNIFDLPEEILIYIIKKLDFKSCLALYNTCYYLRNMVTMKNVIKECHFSMNKWATRYSLKLNLVRDISGHLLKLNLAQVTNLNHQALLTALKNMPRLESINVSFTPITILDLIGVQKYCCNLRDITINFVFLKYPIKVDTLLKCKNFFKNFKYVHFVGNPQHLIFSTIALRMLEEADLHTINFTVSDAYDSGPPTPFNIRVDSLRFKNFNIFLSHRHINYFRTDLNLEDTLIIKMLQESVSQFIILCAHENEITETYYSPEFVRFFSDHTGAKRIENIQSIPYGRSNIAIMLWNKENVFDNSFYKQVEERLSNLPYTVKSTSNAVPAQYKWICVNEEHTHEEVERNKAKRRCVHNDFVLDYNEILSEHKEVQLTVLFLNVNIVGAEISQDCSFLKKLTFLCLKGPLGCDVNFFMCIMRNCTNLKTLSIISSNVFTPVLSLSQLLPLSKSLRNFRLVSRNINLNILFKNLARCTNFENIYIRNINNCDKPPMFPNPCAIFRECSNLYSFVIVDSFPNYHLKRKIMLDINKYKAEHNKSFLNVNIIHNREDFCYIPYSPSLEVFNETILKQI